MSHKAKFIGITMGFVCFLCCQGFLLRGENKDVQSGQRYERLLIYNVHVVDGNGTPLSGPVDVVLKKNKIESVRRSRTDIASYDKEAHLIDGTGLYLLPGLINIHAHIHDQRGGKKIPFEYLYKLWLSCGITTVRDVGSNYKKTIIQREKSASGQIIAPRILLYMRAFANSPQQMRLKIRDIKKQNGDGVKIFGMDRDIMAAALQEAHLLGLPVAHHVGVEETDASDDAALGVTSIEHWYGVPDAALHGSQRFPSWYNYNNENHRFRYAGRLWREADPDKLKIVLTNLIKKGVAWCPTFVIYEANRDLMRAQNQPWFKDYLHPSLKSYFKPDPDNHGSYHWNWSTSDEVFWK